MLLLLFILTNLFASFFQGIVGFGHGLIASPLSLTFLDKNTVLTSVMIIGTFLNLFLMLKISEPLDKKIFFPLFTGSLIGMPFGILVLKLMPINTMRIVVGSLSIFFTFFIVFAKIKIHKISYITPIIGLICGVLQTSTGMPGPPVVILLSGSDVPKHSMRKILVSFFLYMTIITLPLFFISRIMTMQGIIYGICAIPFIFIAGFLGNKVANIIPHRLYKALTLITVCATGVFAIYSGLR